MTALENYITGYFGIPPEKLKAIASLFEAENFQKGDFFIRQGHYCNRLSFIRSGYLRIFAANDHKEITQWISTKDYFLTDLSSFMFNTPARWNIQALTDGELYSISQSNYRKIGMLVPEWKELEKRFMAKCFLMLEDRVFSFLSMTAEERFRALFEQNSELFNQVPLHFIASMLGMTPETLSRIRKNIAS